MNFWLNLIKEEFLIVTIAFLKKYYTAFLMNGISEAGLIMAFRTYFKASVNEGVIRKFDIIPNFPSPGEFEISFDYGDGIIDKLRLTK